MTAVRDTQVRTSAGLPRLALIRGPFAERVELACIEELAADFSLAFVTSSGKCADAPKTIVRPRLCLGTALEFMPKVRRVYRDTLSSVLGDPMYLVGLPRVVRESDLIDVLETYTYFSYQAAKLSVHLHKVLAVTVNENVPFFEEENALTQRIRAFVTASAHVIIARTSQIESSLLAEGIDQDKVKMVYPSVDTHLFRPFRKTDSDMRKYGVAASDFVIATAGRLVWEKGIRDLVRAFRVVVNRHPSRNPRLLIAGDGREKALITRLILNLGLAEKVTLVGHVAYEDMPGFLNVADLCILASKAYPGGQEQHARLLREALSCGKRIIATDCGGNSEMVGAAGIVVRSADCVELADAVSLVLASPEKRRDLEESARARALSKFDKTIVAGRLTQVYQDALAQHAW